MTDKEREKLKAGIRPLLQALTYDGIGSVESNLLASVDILLELYNSPRDNARKA